MSFEPEMVALSGVVVSQEAQVQPVSATLAAIVEETGQQEAVQVQGAVVEKPLILAELIIEEISIDGMCGVY